MNIAEALDYFLSRVAPELEALGLIRNKKGDVWGIAENPYKFSFQIHISPGVSNPSTFLFHSTFSINRSDLSNYVLNLENNLRKIKSMPALKNKRPLISVTDWQEIYKENDIVDKAVWFASMKEVQENEKFENDFRELVKLALHYFEESKKLNFCIDKLMHKGYLASNLAFISIASSVSNEFLREKFSALRDANSEKTSWNEMEMKAALHFVELNQFKPKYPFK